MHGYADSAKGRCTRASYIDCSLLTTKLRINTIDHSATLFEIKYLGQ